MLTLRPENERYIIMQRSDMEQVEDPIGTYLTDVGKEFVMIKPYLPKDFRSFVDIGCGMGGLALKIAEQTNAMAYLMDSDGEINLRGKNNGAGFHEEYVFYSNIDLLAQNFADNGLSCSIIQPGAGIPDRVDLAISTLSCGFHYPVETYRAWLEKHVKPGGKVILDIRVGMHADLGQEFEFVGLVEHFKRFQGRKHKAERLCWQRI